MYSHLCLVALLVLESSLYSNANVNNSDEESGSLKLDGPVVKLHNGYIRGKVMQTLSGKDIYSFLGIRYAHPPSGELRFKAPVEWLEPWEGVKNSYSDGNQCPQLIFPERTFQGKEDCLFLNVYTTKLMDRENPGEKKLSVLIFLHGGGFSHESGSSEDYGPQHLLEHDMILVFPNYRLGAFGFLSMGDDVLPGNLGLLDQQLALKWVKNNIAAFGGDSNSITLGGAHAGAISTHFHALTPSSQGLFQRAIAISGNPLTSWGTVDAEEAKLRALRLAELLECKPKSKNQAQLSSADLVYCLSLKEVSDIIWKSQFIMQLHTDLTFPFVPVINYNGEGTFLPKHPQELLADEFFADIPWMLGVSTLDGLPHALQIMIFRKVAQEFSESFENSVPAFLGLRSADPENIIQAGRRIREFYSLENDIGFNSLKPLGEVFTDAYYFSTLIHTIKAYSMKNSSPLYAYLFSYNYRNKRIRIGVPQGDDTSYLFPGNHSLLKLKPDDPEHKVVKRMTEIIAAYVNSGDPTKGASKAFTWEPATKDSIRFLNIGQKSNKMMDTTDFYPERMAFWEEVQDILDFDETLYRDEL